jgi:hypothetical protein
MAVPMAFDLKAFLDRELFQNLIDKYQLQLRLISFMAAPNPAGDDLPPPMVWLLLEAKDFAADLLRLLEDGERIYLDHYRNEAPVPDTKVTLFGCDGVPTISRRGAAQARLSYIVEEPPVEMLLELFGPTEATASLASLRAFYDALKTRGIDSLDVAKRFARPGSRLSGPMSPPAPKPA